MKRASSLSVLLLLVLTTPAQAGVAFLSDMQIPLVPVGQGCLTDIDYTDTWATHVATSMAQHYPLKPIDRIHDAGDIVEACLDATLPTAQEYRKYLDILSLVDAGIKQPDNSNVCCTSQFCIEPYVCYTANAAILRAVPGNHDGRAPAMFEEVFGWDLATEKWKSDTVAGIHILGLSSSSYTPQEAAAIRGLLDDDGQGYQPTVVYFHVSPFTGNHRVGPKSCPDPQSDVCSHLVPVFEDEDVDLVISGHAHDYEHMEFNGVTYLVIGGAGAKFQSGDVPSVTGETVVRGLIGGALFHHWVYVEAVAGGLAVEVRRVYEDASGNTLDQVFEQFEAPAKLDPAVTPGSRSHTITSPPGGADSTWSFSWETADTPHQVLDRVEVGRSARAPATCLGAVTLTPSTAGVTADVVPKAGGGYVHTLTWTQAPPCTPGCGWSYTTSSAVENDGSVIRRTSDSGHFKTMLCIQ